MISIIQPIATNGEKVLDDKKDFEKVFNQCRVSLTEKETPPEIYLSIGVDQKGYPIPICTEGEFSCIVAPSKTKKSFLKSIFSASYIGGKSNIPCPHVTGHRKSDDYILDVDTEQGKFYAQRTFQRTMKLVGEDYPYYLPLYTRKLKAEDRVKLIDWVLRESQYKGKIKMVFIDGCADLLEDTNNLVMSNEVANYLLKWTDELKIHVCTIIHKTYGYNKPTGHLGTAVTKKAETLIYIDPLMDSEGKNIINFNTVKVRCGLSRGKMFDDFLMTIDANGLPFTHDIEPIAQPNEADLFSSSGKKKTTKSDDTKTNQQNKPKAF